MSATDSHSIETWQRIALAIEYDGAAYSGWQRQASPELPTIQSSLERALSQVANTEITATCAGRTDAGVHATCQVIHFDSPVDRSSKAWTMGVNSLLPETIRVRWSQTVDAEFHARFSATARQYFYIIYCSQVGSTVLHNKVTHSRDELNYEVMNKAAQTLLDRVGLGKQEKIDIEGKMLHGVVLMPAKKEMPVVDIREDVRRPFGHVQ